MARQMDQFSLLAPLERVIVPIPLDSSRGSNRSMGSRQISADNDVDAIKARLGRFLDKQTTLDNYREEAERLLLWSTNQMEKPISSLTHEDWLIYQAFLLNPRPRERWVACDGRKFPRSHPQWKPFAGPLSGESQRQSGVILNSMFSRLVNAGYLAGNPLSLSRERKRRAAPRITRYLDEDIWPELKATVDALPRETDGEREHYFRLRWLISLFYVCGLRISEFPEQGFPCARLNADAAAQGTRPRAQPLHGRCFHKEFAILDPDTLRVKRENAVRWLDVSIKQRFHVLQGCRERMHIVAAFTLALAGDIDITRP